MKEYQIYNAAIEDVLEEIKKWWDKQTPTQNLINSITRLKKDVNVGLDETGGKDGNTKR